MTSDVMARIAKLLNKAEATDSAAEAEAFTDAAQRIATEHSIDMAIARARHLDRTQPMRMVESRVEIGEPRKHGNRQKILLMHAVANNNDVHITIAHDNTHVSLYGASEDVDVVTALYSSLVVQMTDGARRYVSSGAHREHEVPQRRENWFEPAQTKQTDVRTAKKNFHISFVHGIDSRLRRVREDILSTRDANVGASATSQGTELTPTALALVDKAKKVKGFYTRMCVERGVRRSWRGGNDTYRGRAGVDAGRTAAEKATLSDRKAVGR